MANLPSENSSAVNTNNQQRPDQNLVSAGPTGAGEGINGSDDGGLPFRYISPAAQNTFQYLRKTSVKNSSASAGGRNVEGLWTPFVFQLIPQEDNNSNEEKSELFKNIRLAGGTNYPGKDVETDTNGVVRILNEDYFVENEGKDCLVPLDTYSSMFVYRCISNRNKGLPMPHPSKYLIPSSTSKFAPYDARRILRRELQWEGIEKLVFPPNHKRISAQQWIEELRRLKAKVMASPQNHPDARKSFNGPSTTTRTKLDAPKLHERKRTREPDDADKDENRTHTPSPKRREVPIIATRLSTSPPPSSNELSGAQKSEDHELEPVAGPSRLYYASSAIKPRRLQFQRLDAANESAGSSASMSSRTKNTNGIEQRAQVPRASSPKPSTSSKLIGQSPLTRPAAVSASSSPRVSCSSKTKGKLATTCQTSSSSALPSSSRSSGNVTSRQQINLKYVASAGPSRSRRGVTKPQLPPVRDDAWVNCNDSSGGSSDDSVHFSDNPDVGVKPKLRIFQKRQEYSIEEGQRLLDLVCALNAFLFVKGNDFWKQVEGSKRFKDRTYQSLKEHYKNIVKKVTSKDKYLASEYKISLENLVKLKQGWANKDKKHAIITPDFTMQIRIYFLFN